MGLGTPDFLKNVFTNPKKSLVDVLAFLKNISTHSLAAHSLALQPLATHPKRLSGALMKIKAHQTLVIGQFDCLHQHILVHVIQAPVAVLHSLTSSYGMCQRKPTFQAFYLLCKSC